MRLVVGVDIDNTLKHATGSTKDEYTRDCIKGLYLRGVQMKLFMNVEDLDLETFRSGTFDWLEKEGLVHFFTGLHITAFKKQEYCMIHQIPMGIMVEDDAEEAEAFLKAGIHVVLFDTEENRHLEHKRLSRVTNWWEAFLSIVEIINELESRIR